MKRQATEWEEIFVNHISDKELVPRIRKELSKLSSKITNNPIRKLGKDMHSCFNNVDIWMARKHIKK